MFPLFVAGLLFVSGLNADLTITLPDGQIRGHELKTFTDKSYYAYQGIPYAAPPLGSLRFQAPQPPNRWGGILDATKDSNICYQQTADSPTENEDCLYINVFTPVLNATANTTKLPVVFWIYGGGFRAGASTWSHNRPEYFMDEGLVLVAFNYRVGPFGFLSTGDTLIPGNAGLKDQNFALKWTHQNIELFGGDPQKITIFGQSAGGASVGYHLLSKSSSGLFRAAIADSGSPLNTWTYLNTPKEYAVDLAQVLDSSFSSEADSISLMEFLQSADAKAIDVASTKTAIYQAAITVEPEHDGAFITQPMYEQFLSGDINRVPVLMGINSEERITMAENLSNLRHQAELFDAYPYKLVPDFFPTNTDLALVGEEIKKIYVSDLFANNLGRTIRYSGDNRFTKGIIKQAQLLSPYTNVYFYQFSYDGILGCFNITIDDAEKVGHAEELHYIFTSNPVGHLQPEDALTHKRMVKLWTNFVKYLNPTPSEDSLLQNIIWPTVSPDFYQYLDIDEDLEVRLDPKGDWYKGWVNIYNTYGVRPFTTY